MTDKEKDAILHDLVLIVAEQAMRISALEEALHDSGVLDTASARNHLADLRESLPILPAALDLASARELFALLEIPERKPGDRRRNRAPQADRSIRLIKKGREE